MRGNYDKFAEELIKLSHKYHFENEISVELKDYPSKMALMSKIFKSINKSEQHVLFKSDYRNIKVDINKLKISISHHNKIQIYKYFQLCLNDINLFNAMVKVLDVDKKYFNRLYHDNELLNKLVLSKKITEAFNCVLDINDDINEIYNVF